MSIISKIDNSQNALVDHTKKFVLFWTPRAACTTSVSTFYKHMGLFDEVKKTYNWINDHQEIFYKTYGRINQNILNNPKYVKIKIVRDPYKRAVSNYNVLVNHLRKGLTTFDITFKEYLKRVKRDFNFNPSINYHSITQYSSKDKFVNKIIKIENVIEDLQELDKTFNTNFRESYDYIMACNSNHIRTKNTNIDRFIGNVKASEIAKLNNPDYKWFYNNEIKKLVEDVYGKDIINYNYEYPF
jgi:hypothetical protein